MKTEHLTIDKNKESEDQDNKPETTLIVEQGATDPKEAAKKPTAKKSEPKEAAAKFKSGVEIRPFGQSSLIGPKDLTDEIATWLLDSERATKEDFETLPKGWKEKTKTTK